MKVKASFDKKAIQDFFVLHAEKIVLAGMGICSVLMVYKAMGRESFDQTPEKLVEAATRAEEHWVKITDAPAVIKERFDDPEHPVKQASLVASDYQEPTVWYPPIAEKEGPRPEPRVLTVEGVRGTAGIGTLSISSQADRARPQATPGGGGPGRRWVVLTAKVPHESQLAAYDECFKGAQGYDAQKDVPEYAHYEVEREEVGGRGGPAQGQRTLFNSLEETERAKESWTSPAQEVVDSKYIDETLVFPLPPRADRTRASHAARPSQSTQTIWGEEVAYPPDIPLRREPGQEIPEESAPPKDGSGVPDPDFAEPFGADPDRPAVAAPALAAGGESEYRLFRFFDFAVEPGKKYRYRVRLVLKNPNARRDLGSRFLAEHVLTKRTKLEEAYRQARAAGNVEEAMAFARQWSELVTEWSEPTDIIRVPRDTWMLAVSVEPSLRTAAEPSGKVMLVKFDLDRGEEVHKEFEVKRGKVLNFSGGSTTRPPRRPRKDEEENLFGGPREPEENAPVEYISDVLAVDMRGGQHLGRRRGLTAPGEILVLEPDGTLVVRNELSDLPEYQRRTMTEETERAGGRDPGYRPPPPGGVPGPGAVRTGGNLGDLRP